MYLPFGNEPWSTFFVPRRLGPVLFSVLLVVLRVLNDWWLASVLWWLHSRCLWRLYAFTLSDGQRTIVNAGAAVNLNDNPGNKLLHTLHFTRLISFFVKLAASTACPITQLPKRRARLTVTFHEAFVNYRLLHVCTFLRRISTDGFPSDTTNYWLLWTPAAGFAVRNFISKSNLQGSCFSFTCTAWNLSLSTSIYASSGLSTWY